MSSPRRNENEEWGLFSATQWIYWIGATLTASMTVVIFFYSTFQTKSEANDNKMDLYRRLERIENKIDRLSSN